MAKATEPFDRSFPSRITSGQRAALAYLAKHKGIDKPRAYHNPCRICIQSLARLGLAEPWGTGWFITPRGAWVASVIEVDGRTVEGRKRRGRKVGQPRKRPPAPSIGGLSLDAAKALLDAWRKS
jgi:hypothetical protein